MESLMDSQIKELEQLHQRADELVILMRFQGTPSLLEGVTVSQEGALDVIKKVASKLLDIIYRSFDRILGLITGTRNQAENRIVTAKALLNRIDDLPPMKSSIVLNVPDATYLTVTGDTPNPMDMVKGLDKMRSVFTTEAIDNMEFSTRIIDKLFPKIDTILNRFDSLQAGDVTFLTQSITDDVFQLRKKYLSGKHLKPAKEIHHYTSGLMLGIVEVEYKAAPIAEADLRSTNYKLTGVLDSLMESRGYLKNHTDDNSTSYDVLAADPKAQRVLLEKSIQLLTTVTQFHVRYYKQIEFYRKKIKYYRNVYNNLSRDNQNDESKVYLRKLSRVLHTLNRWIYAPAIPLQSHAIKTANGIIQYCQRSQTAIKKQ